MTPFVDTEEKMSCHEQAGSRKDPHGQLSSTRTALLSLHRVSIASQEFIPPVCQKKTLNPKP